MARRIALSLISVAVILTLAGCTGRSLVISWSPNPIVLKPGDTKIEGEVTVKAEGMFGSLRIETVSIVALDKDGDVIDQEKFDVNVTIPPLISGSHTEPVSLNVSYEDIEEHGVAKVIVNVTGSDPGTLEIEIKLDS